MLILTQIYVRGRYKYGHYTTGHCLEMSSENFTFVLLHLTCLSSQRRDTTSADSHIIMLHCYILLMFSSELPSSLSFEHSNTKPHLSVACIVTKQKRVHVSGADEHDSKKHTQLKTAFRNKKHRTLAPLAIQHHCAAGGLIDDVTPCYPAVTDVTEWAPAAG